MRLLLFSDLHCDTDAASHLVQLASEADILLGAGDFGNAHRGIADCIQILRQISLPAVLVPGNNESYEELTEACQGWESATVLHGSGTEISSIPFFGIGGGIPVTPFGSWSYDFTETEAETLLSSCPPHAVLISHSPPKGTVDVSSSGHSIGSTAVRDTVLRFKPRLVVCGHIHASARQQAHLGETLVINAGPDGVLLSL